MGHKKSGTGRLIQQQAAGHPDYQHSRIQRHGG